MIRPEVLYQLLVGDEWKPHARGVDLIGAVIPGTLDFSYARLHVPLLLSVCQVAGDLVLTGAEVPAMYLAASELFGQLHGDMVRVDRQLSLQGSTLWSMTIAGAVIDGPLDMIGTRLTLTDKEGRSLVADGMRVTDAFLRNGFVSRGAVSMVGAIISENLEIDGRVSGVDIRGTSIGAASMKATNVLMREGFSCVGGVNLVAAEIANELDFTGAKIRGYDREGDSVVMDRARIGASVAMQGGFAATGRIKLLGTRITGLLVLTGFSAASSDFREARCGTLVDDRSSWPLPGTVNLRGFQFDSLGSDTSVDARLKWLRRQGTNEWSADPYEQVIGYYRRLGDNNAARRMTIAKHNDELIHSNTRILRSPVYFLSRAAFGVLLGYGYRRWPAGVLLIAVILMAGLAFRAAEAEDAMVANGAPVDAAGQAVQCGEAYPCFNSLIYGADVVLPIVDFGQDSAWRPVATAGGSGKWLWARWGFIAIGWLLASIFVAAFTALLQRD